MTDQTTAHLDGIRAVGIPVDDQDRALAFYVDTLGFDTILDAPLEQLGGRWIEVRPARSPISVALTPAHTQAPAGVDTGIRFTTTDAAALHAWLSEQGVDVGELIQWEGVPPMFDFRDPDGNVLYASESGGT